MLLDLTLNTGKSSSEIKNEAQSRLANLRIAQMQESGNLDFKKIIELVGFKGMNELLGHYNIVSQVGSGNYGVVVKA